MSEIENKQVADVILLTSLQALYNMILEPSAQHAIDFIISLFVC